MTLEEMRIIRSSLSAMIGWSWPAVLLRAISRRKVVLRRTRWAHESGPESAFVRRLLVAPGLYRELEVRIGAERAYATVHQLLVSVGCSEQWGHLESIKGAGPAAMDRFSAFNDLMDQVGAPRFNRRTYVRQDEDVCHFVITRCVFHDFFADAGTLELTRAFCEVDRRFFPEAFPELAFHRGDSWENTIAYGRDQCEFVFERVRSQGSRPDAGRSGSGHP